MYTQEKDVRQKLAGYGDFSAHFLQDPTGYGGRNLRPRYKPRMATARAFFDKLIATNFEVRRKIQNKIENIFSI